MVDQELDFSLMTLFEAVSQLFFSFCVAGDGQPILQDQGRNRRSLGLSLNLNKVLPDDYGIDADLPLERQG